MKIILTQDNEIELYEDDSEHIITYHCACTTWADLCELVDTKRITQEDAKRVWRIINTIIDS
jgi:hypothetical protein